MQMDRAPATCSCLLFTHYATDDVIFSRHTMTSILLFGLLAAGANVLGGLVLVKSGAHRLGERFLKYLVALGAGFMLAAIFIEILPETVSIWTRSSPDETSAEAVGGAMTLLLAGYLSIQFFEHTLAPHFHFGAETHPESFMRPSAAYTAVGGLWIHTFFDGVSIASAFLVNFKVGLLVFIAILLHKMPEGFTVASIMLASGRSTRTALIATAAIGAATLAGVIGVALLDARMGDAVRLCATVLGRCNPLCSRKRPDPRSES